MRGEEKQECLGIGFPFFCDKKVNYSQPKIKYKKTKYLSLIASVPQLPLMLGSFCHSFLVIETHCSEASSSVFFQI